MSSHREALRRWMSPDHTLSQECGSSTGQVGPLLGGAGIGWQPEQILKDVCLHSTAPPDSTRTLSTQPHGFPETTYTCSNFMMHL